MVKRSSKSLKAGLLIVGIITTAVLGSGCGGGRTASSSKRTGTAGTPHTPSTSGPTRTASTGHAKGTHVVYVRPTTKRGSLKPEYAVSRRVTGGDCGEHAELASGTVYECAARRGGYGMCWPLGGASQTRLVFCMRMPWQHSGVEIELQKSLGHPPASTVEQPIIWGLELTSGQRCYHTQGATSAVGGVPIRFACGGPRAEGPVLPGQPRTAQAVWTIPEVYFRGRRFRYHATYGPVGRIAVAWYPEGASS